MPYFSPLIQIFNVPLQWDFRSDLKAKPLDKLVALHLREYTCNWFLSNFDRFSLLNLDLSSLSSIETLVSLIRESLGYLGEVVVSSEISNEDSSKIVIINILISKLQNIFNYVEDPRIDDLRYLNSCLKKIHQIICAKRKGQIVKGAYTSTWLIWCHILIQLAQYYFNQPSSLNIYLKCLGLAQAKLQLIVNQRKNNSESQKDAYDSIAYIKLLKAGMNNDDSENAESLAKNVINILSNINPSSGHTYYNLACAYAIIRDIENCKNYLMKAQFQKILPPVKHLKVDKDLDCVQNDEWFKEFLLKYPSSPPSLERQCINPLLDSIIISAVSKYSCREKNESEEGSIKYDEDMNRLCASLLREGFTQSQVYDVIKEVYSEKNDYQVNQDYLENRKRLNERLEKGNFKERCFIPGDGNCQFHSLSDQLFENIEQSFYIRKVVVEWLIKNKDFELPNRARIKDFACGQTWEAYCESISKPGIWGDHLTLIAASEYFGAQIVIISSVKGLNYITKLTPKKFKTGKVLYLCHFAEFHYGSLCKIEEGVNI